MTAATNVNLFASSASAANEGSGHTLAGTARLTFLATALTNDIVDVILDDESLADQIVESQRSNEAMDELIRAHCNLEDVDVDFLRQLSAKELNGMLKSQQSKRSRTKSKEMTLDNYKTLMVGAISELLIRDAGNIAKLPRGRSSADTYEFTDEQLQAFERDQDELRRELRNIQSKKSIMKKKLKAESADGTIDESSPRWQSLLRAEEQLKQRRSAVQDSRRDTVLKMLSDADFQSLTAEEARELLAKIEAELK